MAHQHAAPLIAAVASFFIPGLGQLLQGRWLMALMMFLLTGLLWVIWLGWVIHLWSILDAALHRPAHRYCQYRDRTAHRSQWT